MFGSKSGGLFDFNGDGEVSFTEKFLAYNIFEEITNADGGNCSSYDEDDDDDEYDDEDEDPDAADISEDDDDNDDYDDDGVDPDDLSEDDYPNKRSYEAAHRLAELAYYYGEDYELDENEKREKDCCHFILEKADTILAAKYCTYDDGFIYAQAVKDNFKLSVSLPDEDEAQEYNVCEIIRKIGRKDVGLALRVWHWLVDQFLPYEAYTKDAVEELTSNVIDYISNLPGKLTAGMADYLYSHPDFCETVMLAQKYLPYCMFELIYVCMEQGYQELATKLYAHGLRLADGSWRQINSLTDNIIGNAKTYSETKIIECFREKMFPLVKAVDIGMVRDEIEVWEEEIEDYLKRMSYVYDGCDDDEEDDEDDEDDDDDEDDPASVLAPTISQIMEIYTICGVALGNVSQVYHYMCGDLCLQIGDTVRVPAGENELTGTVVSVGQYMGWAAPFPVEKMKKIIKKL